MTAPTYRPSAATNGRPHARAWASSHRWVWYFIIVTVLTVAAVAILWIYNLQQQLTPEQLAAARQRWKEHGPLDYDLKYHMEGRLDATYTVEVRNGEVCYAEPDPRPLDEKREYYGMPALFRYIEGFLKLDAQPDSPRTFTVATFDPDDGHLIHYVRRVMGTAERLEITVDFRKAKAEKAKP